MNQFQLPSEAHVGHVRLQVADMERSLAFYGELLGFREISHNGDTVALSSTGQLPYHIVLTERRGAQPKPPRTTGLYHVAIRFPTRHALARTVMRLATHNWPFQGAADHLVSEALYLADPDGNGLELYVDRPRDRWYRQDDQIAMATEPLDLEDLLSEGAKNPESWSGAHPETEIGHVHLQVSDLKRAEKFYHDLLGLDITQRGYPGALFMSAGGYHHHLAVNVWAGVGAPQPPPDAVGLLSFALQIPDGEAWQMVLARMAAAGLEVTEQPDNGYAQSALVRDPDGTTVELLHQIHQLPNNERKEVEK